MRDHCLVNAIADAVRSYKNTGWRWETNKIEHAITSRHFSDGPHGFW
jgi:hypothetical protein